MIRAIGWGVAASLAVSGVARPAHAQAVALPLRGSGEVAVEDSIHAASQGSVLLQADSTVKVVFVTSGVPTTVLAGEWRMAGPSTAEFAVRQLLGNEAASGDGEIRFRPDGSVEHVAARGRAAGREFTLQFDNEAGIAGRRPLVAPDSVAYETGRLPPPQRREARPEDDMPWGGEWAVVDVSRHGEGRLTDAMGRELRFDRARLTLGENDEFRLVLDGEARIELAGTWEGDPRDNPVRLRLRESSGEKMAGVGRVWLRQRTWDRDWSFERVELDGWNDEGGDALTLSFEAASTR
jgi:hypothetical protein